MLSCPDEAGREVSQGVMSPEALCCVLSGPDEAGGDFEVPGAKSGKRRQGQGAKLDLDDICLK